jgi:hypothetical protein
VTILRQALPIGPPQREWRSCEEEERKEEAEHPTHAACTKAQDLAGVRPIKTKLGRLAPAPTGLALLRALNGIVDLDALLIGRIFLCGARTLGFRHTWLQTLAVDIAMRIGAGAWRILVGHEHATARRHNRSKKKPASSRSGLLVSWVGCGL